MLRINGCWMVCIYLALWVCGILPELCAEWAYVAFKWTPFKFMTLCETMPAVGVRKARTLARTHQLPLVGVHHMEAHALVVRYMLAIREILCSSFEWSLEFEDYYAELCDAAGLNWAMSCNLLLSISLNQTNLGGAMMHLAVCLMAFTKSYDRLNSLAKEYFHLQNDVCSFQNFFSGISTLPLPSSRFLLSVK